MSCKTHDDHAHKHGAGCGHTAVQHGDHTDYLHDDHLHHPHGDHVDEHCVTVDNSNKDECTPSHKCNSHDSKHTHGAGCGHEAIPHGDHVDYVVAEHLHRPCGDHCDDHGKIAKK